MGEFDAYNSELVKQYNQSALADFSGLSPEQMSHLLYAPFTSPETISFGLNIDPGTDSEIMVVFLDLAQAASESGLKATARGNLPLAFCKSMDQKLRDLHETGSGRHRIRPGGIRSETDVDELHVTRLVAELAGLIRKYRGRFVLTKKCQALLANENYAEIYFELFKSYTTKFNWAFRDGYPEAGIVQFSFLYTLFLLKSFGDQQRPQEFYEDRTLVAFPSIVDSFADTDYSTAESSARRCYVLRAVERFAQFFGLVDLEWEKHGLYGYRYLIRKTALLDRFVAFTVSAAP